MANLLEVFDRVTVLEDFARKIEQAKLKNVELSAKKLTAEIYLESEVLFKKQDLFGFCKQIKDVYKLSDVKVFLEYKNLDFSQEYFNEVIFETIEKCPCCKAFIRRAGAEIQGEKLVVSNITGGLDLLKEKRCDRIIEEIIRRELGINVVTEFVCESLDLEKFKEETDKIMEETRKQREEKRETVPKPESFKDSAPWEEKKDNGPENLLFGKPIKGDITEIISLTEREEPYVIKGEVLFVEAREIKKTYENKDKNGKDTKSTRSFMAIKFDIGDDTWATSVKLFGRKSEMEKAEAKLKEGALVKVKGKFEMERFEHKLLITGEAVELLEKPPIRMDNSPEKRVELHLHTKMSAKDAVSSPADLIKRAAKWGHKAIAITDHGVVQAFPEACGTAGKLAKEGQEIKILYGTEGYFVNDKPMGLNTSFKDETYIVFDIETTGLDCETEKITEIGAVKVENGKITDKFGELINPEKEIPLNITELTGITNEMVADKENISVILPKFLEFCGHSTVVAHNAKFDTGFIGKNCRDLGLRFSNKVMDTIALSKELFPEERKHNLDALVNRLGVVLDNHHRAVDDATATAECFIKLMAMQEEKFKDKDFSIDTNPDLLKEKYDHIIILAKDTVGLKNLYKIISASNIDYFYKKPRMPKSLLMKHREGLIIGSACEQGELFKAVKNHRPQEEIEAIASFYDYLEIQPIGNNMFMLRKGEVSSEEDLRNLNREIVALGEKLGKPVVATCDVHFMDPEDALYRKILLGAQGYADADEQAPLYFRTTEEMLEEFSYLGEEKAYEVVVKNTNLIADMIENFKPLKDGSYPPSIENCEEDLEKMCRDKAHRIYGEVLPDIVKQRMDRELNSIIGNGYAVMYMIAHKLVKKSNEAGYLVGSRGSVGSSFAAYLADITEVNALAPHYICDKCQYSEFFEHDEYKIGIDMPRKECPCCGEMLRKDGFNIPFETFLGFKGDKVPDIDLNFSGEYQATAHKYVEELFGEGYVFKAGTIGTIADKTAMGFYGKKYYENKGITPPEAELRRVSKGLVDVKNTTGQHPGGVIVCPKTMDIHDFTPVQHPADKKESGIITTHFDFHSIHDNLLKLDILGHDDPSTIRMLEVLTGIDATKIPLDDPETMKIFSGTEAIGVTPEQINSKTGTFGIPEFGTNFTRQMLLDTLPTTFYELVLIAGLSHGTDVWLNNAQDLVRSGTATLSEVIGLRDDIMTYLIFKGLDPSMSFKIMEFVRKGRAAKEGMPEEYESAMREHDVPEWYIDSCKKIKYMFPKAHAAAYVMMAYRVAYFKVHYPTEFYIAYYTVRADLFDAKIMAKGKDHLKNEMRRLEMKGQNEWSATEKSLYTIMEICYEMYERGIEFLPVDLYKSHAFNFQKVGDKQILLPFNSFQGMGDAAAKNIMDAREDGPFLSKEELKVRAKLNKNVMETLEESGCLKGLEESNQISFI
ncbi:MAG: PolC-type DNA polymerase III [Clostridia bacterium]|nr:PolC-type DNA polymerase III [Clostridia bacterium]